MIPKEDYYITKNEMKIFNKLYQESLPLIKLANDNPNLIQKTKIDLKRLMINGFIDVELCDNKTLFTLTDKSIKIVIDRRNEIKKSHGELWGKSFYIDSKEFKSKTDLENYIMSIILNYKEDAYLSNHHEAIILSCLRYTDWGRDLISKGISRIKIYDNNHADVLSILMNDLSEVQVRVHGFLYNEKYNHKKEVFFAFRYALHTEEREDGLKFYHTGLTLKELTNKFLEENNLSFDDIKLTRVDKHLVFVDESLKNKWVDFYRANAEFELLTIDECNKLKAQKDAVNKCQKYFEKCSVM
jgi:nucleoside-triphosphatase THEP1